MLESKKGAKIIQVELLYGIRTIRLYGDATIEEQGKLSLCYEKNISQDADLQESIRSWLYGEGSEQFRAAGNLSAVFEKRYLQCSGDKRRYSFAVNTCNLK